jgi:hypothetical protein
MRGHVTITLSRNHTEFTEYHVKASKILGIIIYLDITHSLATSTTPHRKPIIQRHICTNDHDMIQAPSSQPQQVYTPFILLKRTAMSIGTSSAPHPSSSYTQYTHP